MASKLVCRGSGKFCRKPGHGIGIWLLLASSAALFLLCFTYIDVRSFYDKNNSNSKELHAALQRGSGSTLGTFTELITPESSPSADDSFEEKSVTKGLESIATAGGPVERNNSAVVVEEAHDSSDRLNSNETVQAGSHVKGKAGLQSEVLVMPGGNEKTKHRSSAAARKKKKSSLSGCDISRGKWVYDEAYPLYRSRNCPFVDPGFRCEENGRPDTDFMKYRWQLQDCDLPRY